jgi:hypothetical protein
MRGLMAEWSFLSNHAGVLVCIADDPGRHVPKASISARAARRTMFARSLGDPSLDWIGEYQQEEKFFSSRT